MSREKSLLERLKSLDSQQRARTQASAQEDLDALIESVRDNMTRILNARHGMSEAMPDYGLPALSDLTLGTGDHVAAVEDAIREALERYEPRLERIRVSRINHDQGPRVLAFRVDATLVSKSGKHRVWYQTEVGGKGEFSVFD